MYEIFEQLLQKYGVTPYKVSKETGVTQTSLSNWKSGRNIPSLPTLSKIADYFGVTVDYLTTGKEDSEKKESPLTEKDARDIQKKLQKLVSDIKENKDGPLLYGDEILDEDDINYLSNAIEYAMNMIKPENKAKYGRRKKANKE